MAKHKEEVEQAPSFEEASPASEPTVTGPVPGMVFLENLMPHELGITLTDATHLSAGPKAGKQNRSRIIPKKLLPPYVRRMEQEGKVRIVDAAEGGK